MLARVDINDIILQKSRPPFLLIPSFCPVTLAFCIRSLDGRGVNLHIALKGTELGKIF